MIKRQKILIGALTLLMFLISNTIIFDIWTEFKTINIDKILFTELVILIFVGFLGLLDIYFD